MDTYCTSDHPNPNFKLLKNNTDMSTCIFFVGSISFIPCLSNNYDIYVIVNEKSGTKIPQNITNIKSHIILKDAPRDKMMLIAHDMCVKSKKKYDIMIIINDHFSGEINLNDYRPNKNDLVFMNNCVCGHPDVVLLYLRNYSNYNEVLKLMKINVIHSIPSCGNIKKIMFVGKDKYYVKKDNIPVFDLTTKEL